MRSSAACSAVGSPPSRAAATVAAIANNTKRERFFISKRLMRRLIMTDLREQFGQIDIYLFDQIMRVAFRPE